MRKQLFAFLAIVVLIFSTYGDDSSEIGVYKQIHILSGKVGASSNNILTGVFVANSGLCQGCCSYHGGVVCVSGITQCGDGTALSYKCTAKGCNKCK